MFQTGWYQEYGHDAMPRISGSTVEVSSNISGLPNIINSLKLIITRTNEKLKNQMEQKHRTEAEEMRQQAEAKRAAEKAMTEALNKLQF